MPPKTVAGHMSEGTYGPHVTTTLDFFWSGLIEEAVHLLKEIVHIFLKFDWHI